MLKYCTVQLTPCSTGCQYTLACQKSKTKISLKWQSVFLSHRILCNLHLLSVA